ncbi:MAG: phage portal protein [Nitrosopumilus sp.]
MNPVIKLINKVGTLLKDKLKEVETSKKHGTLPWIKRNPITQQDIEASKINSSVYIAVRAITDAITSLPVNIVRTEIVGGTERIVDDNNHEANDFLKAPNPEFTFGELIEHFVKSYLLDGNAVASIETMTGTRIGFEVWPRDPRDIDRSRDKKTYRFGSFTRNQKEYRRDRIIHIRDMDITDPFWGIGRINNIREEILMDYFINRFNSRFFKNDATHHLMFVPTTALSETQHQQILDALSFDMAGADNAFQLFINRFPGKFEQLDQKHKDIAFSDLLKSNREKIFGVFGLAPFRGGIMEFANYANALAQDKDFWQNTIKPIIKILEDGLNKQLLWKFYDDDIRIKFDVDSVEAISGTDHERTESLIELKKEGIVSAEYVRAKLSIDEDAAPDDEFPNQPDTEKENKEEKPTVKEKEEMSIAFSSVMYNHRNLVLDNFNKLVARGKGMWAICNSENQGKRIFKMGILIESMYNKMNPVMIEISEKRGSKEMSKFGKTFESSNAGIKSVILRTKLALEAHCEQALLAVIEALETSQQYSLDYRQTKRLISNSFSRDCEFTCKNFVKSLVKEIKFYRLKITNNLNTIVK